MNETVIEIMARMPAAKFRHVPVVEEGRLAGIASIGDEVKWHLDELKHESARRYANTSRQLESERLITPAQLSPSGPERRFWNVRCGAGLGGQADVARINRQREAAPAETQNMMPPAPKRAPFSIPERQRSLHRDEANVTSSTASNIAAVLASVLADLRKRGVKKST